MPLPAYVTAVGLISAEGVEESLANKFNNRYLFWPPAVTVALNVPGEAPALCINPEDIISIVTAI
jgi:hypothetical protein